MGVQRYAAVGLLVLLVLTANVLWYEPSWHALTESFSTKKAVDETSAEVIKVIGSPLLLYHIGAGAPYGRTGNQLITIFHTLDMALDKFLPNNTEDEVVLAPFIAGRHPVIPKNNTLEIAPFIAISGWARDLLQSLYFEPTEPGWSLQLEEKTNMQFLDFERIATDNFEVINVLSEYAYWYTFLHLERVVVPEQKRRRLTLWKTLLDNVSASNLEAHTTIVEQIQTMSGTGGLSLLNNDTYLAIHVRSLEGSCTGALGDLVPADECGMSPTYIKRILRSRSLLGRMPVVVISDMQTPDTIAALENDEEIGKMVIVSRERTMLSDMMIAAHSDIFVGVRISSMACIIGQMRVALGHDPQTNFIYVDEDLHICGECIFFCNETVTNICGKNIVYA